MRLSTPTHGEVRGYEQAYIEHYETKTGVIGEEVSSTNKGSKVNSFAHSSKARAASRQAYFEDSCEAKTKYLKRWC